MRPCSCDAKLEVSVEGMRPMQGRGGQEPGHRALFQAWGCHAQICVCEDDTQTARRRAGLRAASPD